MAVALSDFRVLHFAPNVKLTKRKTLLEGCQHFIKVWKLGRIVCDPLIAYCPILIDHEHGPFS